MAYVEGNLTTSPMTTHFAVKEINICYNNSSYEMEITLRNLIQHLPSSLKKEIHKKTIPSITTPIIQPVHSKVSKQI